MDFPPFPGFRNEGLGFLRSLADNNERDWFKPRKATYDDEVLWPLRCLVADAGRQAAHHGLPLAGDPKRGVFRIYRDTRFSKNKQPYKTHAGACLSRSGSHKDHGSVYIHVQPGAAFLAAGYWQPDGKLLRAWRTRMADDPAGFLAMAEALAAAGVPLAEHGKSLKRMPRGFEALADADIAPYLRWKSFVVTQPVDDAALQSPDFTDTVVQFACDAAPLLTYGWEVIDHGAGVAAS